jgi:P27 family predicted phage terminase small subunit
MAGRRRKPTSAKVLAGTFRKDRANPGEPKPPRGHVTAPDWLKGEARWAWEQLAGQLGDAGTRVLSQQDRHALGLLCDAYHEYRVARRQVEHDGMMVVRLTKAGMVRVKHPLIQVYQDAWRRVRLMLVEFGLTPASRSKTSSRPAEEADPLQELLKRSGNSG